MNQQVNADSVNEFNWRKQWEIVLRYSYSARRYNKLMS